jgi:hypothetical protein
MEERNPPVRCDRGVTAATGQLRCQVTDLAVGGHHDQPRGRGPPPITIGILLDEYAATQIVEGPDPGARWSVVQPGGRGAVKWQPP